MTGDADDNPGTEPADADGVSSVDLDSVVGGVVAEPAAAPPPGADSWGRSDSTVESLAPIFDFLYDKWFRTGIEGIENVPSGGALLVANHAGAVPPDATQIIWAIRRELDRPLYMLGDELVGRVPVLGRVFRRLGGVEANPESAHILLGREGRLGLVFPEGTKGTAKHMSERYRLRRFGRGGFVRVALDAGVPVVPVAVMGAEEAMPVIGNLPRAAAILNVPYLPIAPLVWLPVKFRVRFLEPIDVAGGPTDDHSIQMLADEIRDRIQAALMDMVAKRRSVVFG